MGAKSCVRVFTDFSKMAHTAWRGNKRSAVLPLNNLWRHAISISHSKITCLVAHVSDSPPQLESRWATYWASFVWEQRLAAEPPPPESRKMKKIHLNQRNALKQAAKLNISIVTWLRAGRTISLWLNKKKQKLVLWSLNNSQDILLRGERGRGRRGWDCWEHNVICAQWLVALHSVTLAGFRFMSISDHWPGLVLEAAASFWQVVLSCPLNHRPACWCPA